MNWFRLYSEARNDAKLRTLTDSEHRVWFNLLCYAAEQKPNRGEIRDFDLDLLAIEVANGDTDLLIETLKKLSRLRIVRATQSSEIVFLKFEERQYDKPSDRPAHVRERVQAHREKQKSGVSPEAVTPAEPEEASRNAPKRDVTPSNAYTQNRTENTQKISAQESTNAPARQKPVKRPLEHHDPDGLRRFYDLYPRKKDPKAVQEAWDKLRPDTDLQRKILENVRLGIASQDWHDDAGRAIPYPATYLNNGRWEDTYTSLLPARASPNGNGSRPPAINGAVAQVDTLTAQIDKIRGR